MINYLNYFNPYALKVTDPLYSHIATKDQIQVEVGSPNFLVDGVRNILSILAKIMFFNSNMNSGNVSAETIEKVKDFLHENKLHDVAVSVNQYKPQQIWSRTFTNPKTSLLSKCTSGIGTSLFETLAFPRLTGFPGDHYNPTSNTIHLFSNDLAIALHECGHAKDFNERENPMLYALTGKIPFIGTLYQEYKATDNAIQHLKDKNLGDEVTHAFKVLIPAFATYCAGAILTQPDYKCLSIAPAPVCHQQIRSSLLAFTSGFIIALLVGHVAAHALAAYSSRKELPPPVSIS